MSEKPIIFSGPMVRAILDGTKTQDRRALKGRKAFADMLCAHRIENVGGWPIAREYDRSWPIRTGYAPGDRLWVRETFCYSVSGGYDAKPGFDMETGANSIWYRATDNGQCEGPWRPSIHMPRWASRINLLVTAVRVERLQEITSQDAVAEGITETQFWTPKKLDDQPFEEKWWDDFEFWNRYPKLVFPRLWDSINAKRPGCSWTDNPWLAAISFEAV